MVGWIVQLYRNVPVLVNVTEKLAWPFIVPESNEPSTAVTVCGISVVFVQVTVSPTLTVRSDG
jgi:hypothetical protein